MWTFSLGPVHGILKQSRLYYIWLFQDHYMRKNCDALYTKTTQRNWRQLSLVCCFSVHLLIMMVNILRNADSRNANRRWRLSKGYFKTAIFHSKSTVSYKRRQVSHTNILYSLSTAYKVVATFRCKSIKPKRNFFWISRLFLLQL